MGNGYQGQHWQNDLVIAVRGTFSKATTDNGFDLLAINVEHAAVVIGLPFHHHDPFDRLITAQSITDGMVIVSVDKVFDDYGITRIW